MGRSGTRVLATGLAILAVVILGVLAWQILPADGAEAGNGSNPAAPEEPKSRGQGAHRSPPAVEAEGAAPPAVEEATAGPEFAADFDAPELDDDKWLVTRKHDFAEFSVDVDRAPGEQARGRLRLRCGTIGTDDKTVKSLGVVSRRPLDLSGRKCLSLDFDWNDQFNGCYLTGAVYLCPTLTTGNPADDPTWLRLE
jgi:hypothetical protein